MKKIFSKIFLSVAVFLLLPCCAFGAPSNLSMTNSTIQHDQSVTVMGTSFGTKISGNAAPLKWDTFEDGTVGNDISSTGYWEEKVTGPTRPVFSSDYPRNSNSSLSIKHDQYGVGTNNYTYDQPYMGMAQFWKNNIGFATTKKAYVNFWIRMDHGPGGPADPDGYQIKIFRIVKDIVDNSGNPGHGTITTSFWTFENGSSPRITPAPYEPYHHYYHSQQKSFSDIVRAYTDTDHVVPDEVWTNISLEYVASSFVGANDAYYKMFLQRDNGGEYFTKDSSQCGSGQTCYFDSPVAAYYDTDQINALKIEFNFDNFESGHPEILAYTDDVYADNSWARVEIGDASTYDNCTHREIQIPSAWTDTGITFTANQGSFAGGQAYLYVIDENGVPNAAGYPITLTSGGDTTAPASPNGLSVS